MRRNLCVHVACYTFRKTFLNIFKSNTILSFRKTFSFYVKGACDEEPITILHNSIQCLTAFTVKNIVFACLQHHCPIQWKPATTKVKSPRDVTVLMKSYFKIFTIKLRRPGHLLLCTPWNYFPGISIIPFVIYETLYRTLHIIQLQAWNSELQKFSAEVLQKLSAYCQKWE